MGEAGLSKAQDTSHTHTGVRLKSGRGACRVLSSFVERVGGRWPSGEVAASYPKMSTGKISQLYHWKRGISLLRGLRVSRVTIRRRLKLLVGEVLKVIGALR